MEEFFEIVTAHLARYPHALPQDLVKLAFQSEFGPEHLVSDPQYAFYKLMEESLLLSPVPPARPPEPIGSGLCRLHLGRGVDFERLAAAFLRAAAEHRGTPEGLEQRLQVLEGLSLPGMAEYLAAYRAAGCPAVHHSETFRTHYAPHYRVILLEDAPSCLPE